MDHPVHGQGHGQGIVLPREEDVPADQGPPHIGARLHARDEFRDRPGRVTLGLTAQQ